MADPVRRGSDRAVVNRPYVCTLESEAGPGIGLNGLAHSDAHTDTSAQTMLRAEMLLRRAREMQQGYYCGKCNTEASAGDATLH